MTTLTRRSFLKGAGMTAGAFAISSVAPMPVFANETQWLSSFDCWPLGRDVG